MHVPLTIVLADGDEVERPDLPRVEARADDGVLAGEVDRLLDVLPDRERDVLVRRARGETLEKIGLVLGTSRERVRQLETKALATLRQKAQPRRHGRVTKSLSSQ